MPTRLIESCAFQAARLPRAAKVAIALTADSTALPLLLVAALSLRRASLEQAVLVSPWLLVSTALLMTSTFALLGMYRAVFRFISRDALYLGATGVVLASSLLAFVNSVFFAAELSVYAISIFAALALLYLVSSRAIVRELLYYRRGVKERVVIYGAGSAGVQLARSLRESGQYTPVAFLDADATLQRSVMSGLKVFAPEALPDLIKRDHISSVLLAIPSTSRRRRQAILKSLEPFPVHVRTVPDISDIVAGNASVADIREVDASDLLGRDPVPPNEALLDGCIRDKRILITGAGGSIGSELCRQIIRSGPNRVVLLEMSEAALYQIDRELRMIANSDGVVVEIIALLGNAHHRNRMREIMRNYEIQTVYHAAAYKHVPIVEQNIIEGIHNNVFSTLYAAESALECGVETFVLISTDKAVNPTNVMGATKRCAELTLQALQTRSAATRFCMVRFGNVLESSGSVVPLFREQIKRGGPVTVTHKDIIRYFMTIPEAAQLVIQAGSMAKGGDVFVLDMSEPVRIDDLARRMVHLMGLTVRDQSNVDGDIEIAYTGLRPAEKLYEELLIGDNVTATEHPMIMRAIEHLLPWTVMKALLDQILVALNDYDCERARALLMDAVTEYRPASGIQDHVWIRGLQLGEERSNVTDIRTHRLKATKPAVQAAT